MKVTKLGHACLDITNNGDRLLIDLGKYSGTLSDYSGITAIVVTHVHMDHLDESQVLKITQQNPNVPIFGTQQVADALSEDFNVTVVDSGVEYQAGSFKLEFFGGLHDVIMPGRPQDQNVGVLVNDGLYYPGDSFTTCDKLHQVTAAPAIAPWAKVSESADFIRSDSAKIIIPTHNAIASDGGNIVYNSMLQPVAEDSGKEYRYLKPGNSLEI